MNVTEAIETRHSCRHFSKEHIADEAVKKIIDAARLAPSAHNRQNWAFLILEGERKDRLVSIMRFLFDEDISSLPSFCRTSRVSASVIASSSHTVLCLRKKDDMWKTEDLLSCGAAIENMILTATGMGIGSLWIRDTFWTEEKIIEEFHLDGYELVSAIAFGWPAGEHRPVKKKSLEEIIL